MDEKVRNSVFRAVIAALGIVLQVAWILFQMYKIKDYYPITKGITEGLAIIVALRVFGKHINSAVKIPWIFLLLVFPLAGIILYTLFGSRISLLYVKKKFKSVYGMFDNQLKKNPLIEDHLKENNRHVYGQSYYIENTAHYPPYANNDVKYYPEAYIGIEDQKKELEKAEKFIFMEYHAIEDSQSWHAIEEILIRKVKEGVDVRIIYDDVGSLTFIGAPFKKRLESEGIKCRVFNPVTPLLNIFMNNRDHRKITVIDGKVGFTGGYNLADEYFNIVSPYGYWKDTGIRIKGDAVDTLTVLFLEMWNAIKLEKDAHATLPEFIRQIPETEKPDFSKGIVQPFADVPLDEEHVSENIYLNLAKNATEYLYITTPYLLIDDIMVEELTLAAKRGVDVRIMTPGIPDKKFIYKMTRSYYASLARHGVRIYEYSPGFLHAKQHISDDKYAVIGTINMDYRSLYLHFENGVYLYNVPAIMDMKKDFNESLEKCREVTKDYAMGRTTPLRIWQCILRLFAPLM